MIIVESAGLTDVGLKRKSNEDAFHMDDDLKLYVVADGMGGHNAGEVASRILVDTVRDYMNGFKTGDAEEELIDPDERLSKAANRLLSAVYLANRAIYKVAEGKSEYAGMGSTVSAVYLSGDTLLAANVGDSPIYLVRNGTVELLSTPHTLLEEQRNMFPGEPLPQEENFRHILTKAMGLKSDIEADLREMQALAGDRIVICSDGLSDKIDPEEILVFVESSPPEKACEKLAALAKNRGGDDNITVIVVLLKKIKGRKEGIGGFFSNLFGRG
jgi:PPM family protein phosphatase